MRGRLRKLRELYAEVKDLEQHTQKVRRTRAATPADLETVCTYATRLRSTAPPVHFPVRRDGVPAAPLPPGFRLPFPTREEVARGAALRSASSRAPPPMLEVLPSGRASSNGSSSVRWEVRVQPALPTGVALLTRDGSLPRVGNAAARSVSAEGVVVPMLPGSQLYVAGFAPGMRRSDVVTVVVPAPAPRPKESMAPSSVATAKPATASEAATASGAQSAGAREHSFEGRDRSLSATDTAASSQVGRSDQGAGAVDQAAMQQSGPLASMSSLQQQQPQQQHQQQLHQRRQQQQQAERATAPAASFRASLCLMTPGNEDDSESDEDDGSD